MPRLMRCSALALVALGSSLASGQEGLLRPVGPNKGETINGLRAEAQAVKAEFGPGESVLLKWSLENVGDRAQAVRLSTDVQAGGLFTFEARRDGKTLAISRKAPPASPSGVDTRASLEPGDRKTLWIDLQAFGWQDPVWLEQPGRYEVTVLYSGTPGGQPIRTKWIPFQVSPPNGNAPLLADPRLEEKVRTLIRQLGAETVENREKAERELFQIGRRALGELKTAAETDADPEIRARCKVLVRRLEDDSHGVPPPALTPPVQPPLKPLPPKPQPIPVPPPLAPPGDEF